jgi:hypothetical protein
MDPFIVHVVDQKSDSPARVVCLNLTPCIDAQGDFTIESCPNNVSETGNSIDKLSKETNQEWHIRAEIHGVALLFELLIALKRFRKILGREVI